MIGSVRHEIRIDRPVDEVWGLVGAPERISEWFPDFVASEVDGSTRRVTTANGLVIDEELLVVDPILRRIQYRLDLPIVTFHRGTLDAIALDDRSTLLLYATDADPRVMALVVGAATSRGLVEARRQLEGRDA